jgi:hypothetical protein
MDIPIPFGILGYLRSAFVFRGQTHLTAISFFWHFTFKMQIVIPGITYYLRPVQQ